MKRYDLMQDINVRGTFVLTKACLPHLKLAANPHVLTLSPPLNLNPAWFGRGLAYAIAKYGMSLCTLGFAEEFKEYGIAANSLWPRTTIATAAVRNLLGGEESMRRSRDPRIVADAAYAIFTRPSRECTGRFFIDDEVLAEEGITDLSIYGGVAGELQTDLFLD
jgi:citronellol/citronellal dehydrogenase